MMKKFLLIMAIVAFIGVNMFYSLGMKYSNTKLNGIFLTAVAQTENQEGTCYQISWGYPWEAGCAGGGTTYGGESHYTCVTGIMPYCDWGSIGWEIDCSGNLLQWSTLTPANCK